MRLHKNYIKFCVLFWENYATIKKFRDRLSRHISTVDQPGSSHLRSPHRGHHHQSVAADCKSCCWWRSSCSIELALMMLMMLKLEVTQVKLLNSKKLLLCSICHHLLHCMLQSTTWSIMKKECGILVSETDGKDAAEEMLIVIGKNTWNAEDCAGKDELAKLIISILVMMMMEMVSMIMMMIMAMVAMVWCSPAMVTRMQ